jgi:hypothetical protein
VQLRGPIQLTSCPKIPEPRPVVVVAVTSSRGVLPGKRNDGAPPWPFTGGEVEERVTYRCCCPGGGENRAPGPG